MYSGFSDSLQVSTKTVLQLFTTFFFLFTLGTAVVILMIPRNDMSVAIASIAIYALGIAIGVLCIGWRILSAPITAHFEIIRYVFFTRETALHTLYNLASELDLDDRDGNINLVSSMRKISLKSMKNDEWQQFHNLIDNFEMLPTTESREAMIEAIITMRDKE